MTTPASQDHPVDPSSSGWLAARIRSLGLEGQRVSPGLLVAVAALAVGAWLWAQRGLPPMFWTGDEYEYADIARRLARGDGFTTGVIFPPHLAYGVDGSHPSLLRPPLWPLWIAAYFLALAPTVSAVHTAALTAFVATAVTAAALASRLAGGAAGLLAGVAVATSPQLHVVATTGLSETSFAFFTTLAYALAARRAHPVWIGVVCGAAYLTRYNGLALLPVFGALLLVEPGERLRAVAWLGAGFALTSLPWWVRNALVTGDPFYSLANLNLYMAPVVRKAQTSLHYQLAPDLGSSTAMHPLEKARLQLPLLLRYWPPASANLAACAGLVLACVRRDRICWAIAGLLVISTAGISLGLALGRYFLPLLPLVLVGGVVGWLRFGGRWRVLGLLMLLAAPLLPNVPSEAPDVALMRRGTATLRERLANEPDHGATLLAAIDAPRGCLSADTLVVGQFVSRLVWATDTLAIYLPSRKEDFWDLLERHPVDFVQLRHPRRVGAARFAEHFSARPGCGEDFYERNDRRR